MDRTLLASSPTSIFSASSSLLSNYNKRSDSAALLSLDEFVQEVPKQIQLRKELSIPAGSNDDPVMKLFRRLAVSDPDEWKVYSHFDSHRPYTRNLIATDHSTYTLLLLCWTPGRCSPIHDHPCDGCWMRVLEGQVQECRYKKNNHKEANDTLICTQDQTFSQGGLVFIEDSLGYHKVGNPSATQPAVTLHLYSPPFASCKIWLDERRKPCNSGAMCHYSEYGKKMV